MRRHAPRLGWTVRASLDAARLTVADLHQRRLEHRELYDLAERLIELDEWVTSWRMPRYKVITRVIVKPRWGHREPRSTWEA